MLCVMFHGRGVRTTSIPSWQVLTLCFWRTFSIKQGWKELRLEHQVPCTDRWNQRPLSLEVYFVVEVHEDPLLHFLIYNGVNGALNNAVRHCCSPMVLSPFPIISTCSVGTRLIFSILSLVADMKCRMLPGWHWCGCRVTALSRAASHALQHR